MCQENNVRYSANMITNGYLLSRSVIERLNALHLKRIQITVDGPKDIHDMRRFLSGKQPTFDRIVRNIKENIDIIPIVSLRINVDLTNYSRIDEVKELFADDIYMDKIYVYIAPVDSINEQYEENKCLTMSQFAELDNQFYDEYESSYPKPRFNACGADTPQSMVIGPDGAIYKCWNDIGIGRTESALFSIRRIHIQKSTMIFYYMTLHKMRNVRNVIYCLFVWVVVPIGV